MKLKYTTSKIIFVCSLSLLFFANGGQSACATELNAKPVKDTIMKYAETFKINKCDKITLDYYKKMSDSRDGVKPKSKEITDKVILEKILLLLNKLPDKGDHMIKMGDVPILNVILTVDKGEKIYFTYFQDMIKTPDTSFYYSPGPKEEKVLFDLLKSILNK